MVVTAKHMDKSMERDTVFVVIDRQAVEHFRDMDIRTRPDHGKDIFPCYSGYHFYQKRGILEKIICH